VGPDLARLLEHGNGQRLAPAFLLELRQPERSRHPRRPAADNEDVNVEGLTSHSFPLPASSYPLLNAGISTQDDWPTMVEAVRSRRKPLEQAGTFAKNAAQASDRARRPQWRRAAFYKR
jgi:hypothetical protein